MAKVTVMFRAEIGFDPQRGYAAVLTDIQGGRMKGIKGNSIRNLMRNVSAQICELEAHMRRFPLEHEAPVIITPNGF